MGPKPGTPPVSCGEGIPQVQGHAGLWKGREGGGRPRLGGGGQPPVPARLGFTLSSPAAVPYDTQGARYQIVLAEPKSSPRKWQGRILS